MIIEQSETTVAYRCPHCGCGVMSLVGVFRLKADRLVLKCQCGESSMSLTRASDGKIRIEVPCLVCAAPHNFTVSDSLFFSQKLFLLPCHASGLDVCFIGGQQEVSDALGDTYERLKQMIEEAGISEEDVFSNEQKQPELPDAHIYDILNFVVRELEYEHNIHCDCDTGPYTLYFSEDGESIIVMCETCAASKSFPANSLTAANDFLNIDEITLE